MKPIPNTKPMFQKGDRIKLINGKNIPIPYHEPYDWDEYETVDHIEGDIIMLKDFPLTTWFTVHMPWEIKRRYES